MQEVQQPRSRITITFVPNDTLNKSVQDVLDELEGLEDGVHVVSIPLHIVSSLLVSLCEPPYSTYAVDMRL